MISEYRSYAVPRVFSSSRAQLDTSFYLSHFLTSFILSMTEWKKKHIPLGIQTHRFSLKQIWSWNCMTGVVLETLSRLILSLSCWAAFWKITLVLYSDLLILWVVSNLLLNPFPEFLILIIIIFHVLNVHFFSFNNLLTFSSPLFFQIPHIVYT